MAFRAFNGIKKIAAVQSADLVFSLCQTSGLYWRSVSISLQSPKRPSHFPSQELSLYSAVDEMLQMWLHPSIILCVCVCP